MTRREKIQSMLIRRFILEPHRAEPAQVRMSPAAKPCPAGANICDDYIRSIDSYPELHEFCRIILSHGGEDDVEMQNESTALLEAVITCILDCFVPETPVVRTAFAMICLADSHCIMGPYGSMTLLDAIMDVCSASSGAAYMLYIPARKMLMEAFPYACGLVQYALFPLIESFNFPVDMKRDIVRYMKPEVAGFVEKAGFYRSESADVAGTERWAVPSRDASLRKKKRSDLESGALKGDETPDFADDAVAAHAAVNPVEIKRFLDETVVGQDDAKISLSVAMANHLNAFRNGMKSPGCTTLLIGPSGSGKTMLAKRLAEYCDLPVVVVDASQITAEGWKGLDKGEAIAGLFKDSDPRRASYGIVILDEFDKLCKSVRDSGTGTYSRRDQETVLGLLGGTPVRISGNTPVNAETREFPTENLFFVLTGAFSQMESSEAVEASKGALGFGAVKSAPAGQDIRDRLMRFGLIPELVGRITDIAFTTPLSEEEAVNAVLAPGSSFLIQYSELLKKSGKSLKVDRDHVRSFVARSFRQGLGVRGVRNMLEEDLRPKIFRAFEMDEPEVHL